MDRNEWNNYTAISYLKYALERYNKVARIGDNEELRTLTDEEVAQIIGCMRFAFDMKTLKEAFNFA